MQRVFVIAEAGVNHNGSLESAKEMVAVAAAAGADAVKFQTFRAETLVCRDAPKAEYQKSAAQDGRESVYEMLKGLELDSKAHQVLVDCCRQEGIMFLSSPFDLASIDFLNELGVPLFKIPSGEITNLPYLRKIGGLGKQVILSTGMAELAEVGAALEVLIRAGTLKEQITVLHCNTEYPTPMQDVNLRAMQTIAERFGVMVGFSDHTLGAEVAVAAVALGARVIEKHFTLSRTMVGPDHGASLEPAELRTMITAIRNIERALGDGLKKPSASEDLNRTIVRKSIVAAQKIKKGELLTEENISVKRPGSGISPMHWDSVIGRPAIKDYESDEVIVLS